MLNNLSSKQINILIASIIGDGEITKTYPNTRRKNNSYREHYGIIQEDYRKWKVKHMSGLFYLTPNSNTLRSKSSPMFTRLYIHFYDSNGKKQIPTKLLKSCHSLYFLAVLYMDDGSLCITPRFNHRKKLIYLTPHIYLYLQNYPKEQLTKLKSHINFNFEVDLKIATRKDGYGHILRTTKVKETTKFLDKIQSITDTCNSMSYKTNWDLRFETELKKYKDKYPDYRVIASCSSRVKPYSKNEIKTLVQLKKLGSTDQKIADELGRTYWSVVYKLSELRKQGKFK